MSSLTSASVSLQPIAVTITFLLEERTKCKLLVLRVQQLATLLT